MKCLVCGSENAEKDTFCHDCGSLIINDFENINQTHSDRIIILGYLIAILFGWGSLILNLFGYYGFINFIGLIFPGFMINSENPKVRKHAYAQLAIIISGIILNLLLFK